MSVNGQAQGDAGKLTLSTDSPLTTSWTFPATTLSLSFGSRQSAFRFEGSISTEITIPPEHTHITINGVETHVDLPGLTTIVEAADSTVVLIELPEATTTLEFTAETYALTLMAYTISTGDPNSGQDAASSYCGTQEMKSATDSACVMGLTTVVTLPTGAEATNLYLHASGLTTAFTLPGITTTFH